MSVLRRSVVGGFVLLASSLALPTASYADTFNLTSCHLSGGCGTATQFGTVTLTQIGANVVFDVTLNSGNRFVETGLGGGVLFAFNDNLPGSTITSITATLNGATVTIPGGFTGLTNQSPITTGAGNFTASVECTLASSCDGSFTPNINGLSFNVFNATIAGLTNANSLGNLFVADILCGQTGCTGQEGPVDATAVTLGVPGPIVGAGLPGAVAACLGYLAFVRRRRRNAITP